MSGARIGRVKLKATGQTFRLETATQSTPAGLRSEPAWHAASDSPRRGRLIVPTTGPNSVIRTLPRLVGRARQLDRNSGLARHGHDKAAIELVGTGIKPLSQCPDRGLARELTQLFEDWSDEADTNGDLDFYGLTLIAARAMAQDGEAWARMRPRLPEDGLTVPLQIQLLETDHIPIEDDPSAGVRAGIVFDGIGRRVGYRVLKEHPGDDYMRGILSAGREWSLVPAQDMCHLFIPRRLNQLRGEPWLTPVLTVLDQLERFQDHELAKQVLRSTLTAAVTVSRPDGVAGPLEGDEDEVDANGAADTTHEPGSFIYLEPGEDIKWFQGGDVGGTFEAFVRTHQRQLAGAFHLLYEQLSRDWSDSKSDRILKIALNDVRRHAEVLQHSILVHQFVRKVYRRVILTAELAGEIKRPRGMSDRDLLRASYHPQAWPYTHPVQDVQAALLAIEGGLDTRRARLAREGEDIEQVDEEASADSARARELGLRYRGDPTAGAAGDDVSATSSTDTADEDQDA